MAFDDIQMELGVATQCGRCEGCARSVWDECNRPQPVAHLVPAGTAQHQHLARV